jgi:hypothetical protein
VVGCLLHDIYRGKFTRIGKKIQVLFAECGQDRASAEDPRVGELRELIRLERAQVAEEDRLYEIGLERVSAAPLSLGNPVLLPATPFWRDMTNQESAFDRQIAAKLNLLMKLRREAAAAALDEENATDEPETWENDVGPELDEATPPPSSSNDVAATASSEPEKPASAPDAEQPATVRPADGAKTRNAGTNPKNNLTASESAPASQPDDARQVPRQGEAPPPPPAGDSGGVMQSEIWAKIEALLATNQAGDYDQAVLLLKNLWDLGLRSGRAGEVHTRINHLRHRHMNKPAFFRRLDHVLPPAVVRAALHDRPGSQAPERGDDE